MPSGSRVVNKASGIKTSIEAVLLASIYDILCGNESRSMTKAQLFGFEHEETKKDDEVISFSSGADFERMREKLLKGE